MRTWFLAGFLAVCSATFAVAAAPELPAIPDKTVKVTDFGAVGDNKTDNTAAIDAAINSVAKAGGGTVDLPPGDFLSGPIHLVDKTRLNLERGATLRMLPLDRYPGGTKDPENFIGGKDLHDIAITGQGTIDGDGAAWWPSAKKEGVKRPIMIHFSTCQRVLIEKVTLRNSPMFHIAMAGVEHVTVRGVTIRAPSSNDKKTPSHNTDACDVSGRHVLIEDCDVSVGDDDFTCGGGTSDVLIRHCTYGEGHGVSIGSRTNGGVDHITVEDCTFNGTSCGIRIKSDRGRGGDVHDLTYRNLRMTNVGMPILIYGSYLAKDSKYRHLTDLTGEIATNYPSEPKGELTPSYHDLTFSHITATVNPGERAGLIWGLPEAPATNILLENIKIKADKPFGVYTAKGVRLLNCEITTPEGVNKLATADADVKITP
jgi:polygalacturonase